MTELLSGHIFLWYFITVSMLFSVYYFHRLLCLAAHVCFLTNSRFVYVHAVVQRSSSSIITVPALPENVLATGYSGLQLKTEIQRATSYNRCRWIYNENVIDIFTPKFSCKNRTESFFELTCVKTNSVVTTRLTIFTPVESDVNASVQCLLVVSGETISSIFLHVTGIVMDLPHFYCASTLTNKDAF